MRWGQPLLCHIPSDLFRAFLASSWAVPKAVIRWIRAKPWCSQLADEDAVAGEDCNSLKSLAVRLASGPIKDKLGGLIGQDVDQLIEVVGSSLDGSTSRLTELTGDDLPSEEGLLGAFEALADKIKNVDVAEAVEAIREGDFDVDSALDALDEVLEGDLDVESALDALEAITERDLDADSALDALDEVLEGGLDVESALDALETITERDLDADSALDALDEVLETDLDVESALDCQGRREAQIPHLTWLGAAWCAFRGCPDVDQG